MLDVHRVEVRVRTKTTAIEEEAQNCYNKEKYPQISMSQLIEKLDKGERLQEEDVKPEHKEAAKKKVHEHASEQRKGLKEKIKNYREKHTDTLKKQEGQKEVKTEVAKALEELDAHIDVAEKAAAGPAAPPEAPKSFLDTAMGKIEEYSKKVSDFLAPLIEKAQDFFAGSAGKLWVMMGLTVPSWAAPEATELRGLKTLFREEFKDLTLERGETKDDRDKMLKLKEIFLGANKDTAPANMKEFLTAVITEAKKIESDKKAFTMDDLLLAAKRKFPTEKSKDEPKKTDEKDKKTEKPKESAK